MYVFLCYASEDHAVVALVEALLTAKGHRVFFDYLTLQGGESVHDKIKNAVRQCDRFVFFLSSASIRPGKFTLSELAWARERWPNPAGRVLPVCIEPVMPTLPPYLSTVAVLPLNGNVAISVLKAIEENPIEAERTRSPTEVATARPLRVGLSFVKLLCTSIAVSMAIWFAFAVAKNRALFKEEITGIFVVVALVTVVVALIHRRWMRAPPTG